MGYDTSLEIGDKYTFMWRKHASELPRTLFSYNQLQIQPIEDLGSGEARYSVKFTGTVRQSLEALTSYGLGWKAAVSAYAAIRVERGQATWSLMAESRSTDDWEQIKEKLEQFSKIPAEVDLLHLGQLMLKQIENDADEIVLLDGLTNEENLPNAFTDAFKAYTEASVYDPARKHEILRAAESLVHLQRDAPLLAWPLIVCVLLWCLPPDAPMELDLSDDAADLSLAGTEEDARTYAAQYWHDSSKALAGTAQSLARLFGVLSSFDGELSGEYWATRAAELLHRLRELNENPDLYTTKLRGDALESLVEALLRAEGNGLTVVEKNFRTTEEEIDILVSNNLADPFWVAQGSPFMLIECKNWKDKVGVPELRVFESKLQDRNALCRIGIFVSLSGFKKTFLERLKHFQATGGIIFAIDGADLEQVVTSRQRLTDWLRQDGIRKALGR
ncbi:restriction endonuclease [Streptomyces sp. NBC_00696]|uniref:restriction endonuclease n=1 Tax=Streptomyces sp. NBC_00696 TaxID=2903672 RepID=UPI002E381243|nr:restriction endonuclease [Streptomyces sp. NBC_00696]